MQSAPGKLGYLLALVVLAWTATVHAGNVTVSGTIGDSLTDAPIEGATLNFEFNGENRGTAASGADGRYEFIDFDIDIGDEGAVSAATFGHLDERVSFKVNSSNISIDVSMRPMAAISGMVNGPSESVGPHVVVRALRYDDELGWIAKRTETDTDGSYEITDLIPGTAYAVCTGGIATGLVQECLDDVKVASFADIGSTATIVLTDGERRTDLDFTLGTDASMVGMMTDLTFGGGLANTRFTLDLYDALGNPIDQGTTLTDAVGSYRLSGIPAGTFRLRARSSTSGISGMQIYRDIDCPGWECPPIISGEVITLAAGATASGIDFSFRSSAVVNGHVADATSGQPLADIEVQACHDGGFGILCMAQTRTLADGSYRLHLNGGQSYWFVAKADEVHLDQMHPGIDYIWDHYEDEFATLVKQGASLNDIDFHLRRSAWISGTVRDAADNPRPYVSISFFDASGDRIGSATSDETGHYAGKTASGVGFANALGGEQCTFFQERPCPPDGQPISSVDPTPIPLADGEQRTGIDFVLPELPIFVNGFESPSR